MQNIFLLILINSLSLAHITAQSIRCHELIEIVTDDYDRKTQVTCYKSIMLTKASTTAFQKTGFAVASIKNNDYYIYGKPYIFVEFLSLVGARLSQVKCTATGTNRFMNT